MRAGIIIRAKNEARWYKVEHKSALVNKLLEEHWERVDRAQEQARQIARIADRDMPPKN